MLSLIVVSYVVKLDQITVLCPLRFHSKSFSYLPIKWLFIYDCLTIRLKLALNIYFQIKTRFSKQRLFNLPEFLSV